MLDDFSRIKKVDTNDMLSQLASLPKQFKESEALVEGVGALTMPGDIFVLGMGGSGIVGDVIHDWLHYREELRIGTNKDLSIPSAVDEDTLLLAISYSGNTKETMTALEQGLGRTKNIVCVTSGGELQKICAEMDLTHVLVPKGYQPRCALGYLLGSAVHLIRLAGVYDGLDELEDTSAHLSEILPSLMPDTETASNVAKKLALELKDRTPVIYIHREMGACANRWQTALNENAKVLSWYGTLPEMMHNEVEAWGNDDRAKDFSMILLRDRDEPKLVRDGFEGLKQMSDRKITEIWSEGDDMLSRMLHLIYIGDFTSYYLAILRGVNPLPVSAIEELKRHRSEAE
jgi:glucose/mannose-6-phosphate isomerase